MTQGSSPGTLTCPRNAHNCCNQWIAEGGREGKGGRSNQREVEGQRVFEGKSNRGNGERTGNGRPGRHGISLWVWSRPAELPEIRKM